MADGGLVGDPGVRETVPHMRASITDMRDSVASQRRSAMMGKAVSRATGVSDVTGMREMSATPGVDPARMNATPMRAAGVTDMHAAAVSSKTANMPAADMGGASRAQMHATTAEVRRTATPATKVRRATTEVRRPPATEMRGAAAATKVRSTTAAAMGRGNRERKSGHAESQSGRQSSNNPMRHTTTPTDRSDDLGDVRIPAPAMVNAGAAAKVQDRLKSNCGDYGPLAWHGRGCDAANRTDCRRRL
jgi:hypothetical protein